MAATALDTPDLDRARRVVERSIAPFTIVPSLPSGYRAHVRTGRVGDVGIAEVAYQGPVTIDGRAPDDAVILEVPVVGDCYTEQAGANRPVRHGAVVATPPGRPLRTRMGERSRVLVFRIPEVIIDPRGDEDPRLPETSRWNPAAILQSDRLVSLVRLTTLIFEEATGPGAVASDGALGAELQRVMLTLLGRSDREQSRRGTVETAATLPRSVRRAQALMIASPTGDVSLPDVALGCGVHVRTLQEHFSRYLGTTPSEWWRSYRLEQVRLALRCAQPDTTVTGAATAYGFFHLGRFAGRYRSRFGETPRDTLLRAREASQRQAPP